MSVKITKIEIPSQHDWGILQINHLSNTYYRFDMIGGLPILDTSFFADDTYDDKKHRSMLQNSQLYQEIQEALSDYIKENGDEQR